MKKYGAVIIEMGAFGKGQHRFYSDLVTSNEKILELLALAFKARHPDKDFLIAYLPSVENE